MRKRKLTLIEKIQKWMGYSAKKDLLAQKDLEIKKLKLELLAKSQVLIVYEKAIMAEREVSAKLIAEKERMDAGRVRKGV